MGDNKKAAKDFVDNYFPMRGEPNSKGADVLGDLFPPNSKQGYVRKQGYESQSFNSQRATTAELQVTDNYYRPDLTKAALARLSVVNRSLKVAKSGAKKRNRQA